MKKDKPSKANTNTYNKQQSKELKRIREFIKNASKRGYYFYDTKVPDSMNMPAGFGVYEVPKSIKNPTKVTINKLKKITKEYLYERAIYVDPQSGEIMTAKEGRHLERSRAASKAAITRRKNIIPPPEVNLNLAILDTVKDYLAQLETATLGAPSIVEYKASTSRYLVDFFDEMVEYYEDTGDIYEYASYLESKATEINDIIDEAVRSSDRESVDMNITAIMAILNRGPLSPSQIDTFTDYAESFGYGGT